MKRNYECPNVEDLLVLSEPVMFESAEISEEDLQNESADYTENVKDLVISFSL